MDRQLVVIRANAHRTRLIQQNGSYSQKSAQLKEYLVKQRDKYKEHLVPIEQLRDRLDKELKGINLSELIKEMSD